MSFALFNKTFVNILSLLSIAISAVQTTFENWHKMGNVNKKVREI